LRFDFSHYQPLTAAEKEEIERLVNYYILRNEPVQTDEMAVEEAMHSGAMALFGEKYGERVRVLTIKGLEGVFSKELCGGTHVRATGDIGLSRSPATNRSRRACDVSARSPAWMLTKRFREAEVLVDGLSSG
jgi:alanyl-tRNA synthetase